MTLDQKFTQSPFFAVFGPILITYLNTKYLKVLQNFYKVLQNIYKVLKNILSSPDILQNSEPELFFRTFEKVVLKNPNVPSYPPNWSTPVYYRLEKYS